ncbi:hypothetical protein HYH03_017004 [Edaphochlamys debaryana]|uniref:Protein kinase domain-containing protein n=1 Tax=Edaphochlamys debaryana TaxID=47281 RepID=A0A835XJ97_9CHLO|nr:hypothetical protein HYH03_017004 [Edaphochlamys debaryana]|eukprot:KAG2484192.1 hypothetical protein HYH03_017004 [Edaphochlamys debaryana]
MRAFEYISTLGEGAYGEVWKCLERASGRTVAIKGFKQAHEDRDIMRLAVREAKMLRSLDHPNLVFEFVGPSVHDELHLYPSGLPPSVMKLVTWQLLRAAAHLHSKKVLHRDIKPANVLLQHDPAGGPPAAKLCDFGFARGTQCGPREAQRCTSYCVTRWYRAPEILVGDMYGPSSDVWSIGCTIAEAATGSPLFSGESTLDQLYRLMRCFGALPPRQAALIKASPRLRSLAAGCPPGGRTLRQRLPALEPRLLELIEACLKLDPSERPTAAELLQMPYFWDVPGLVAGTHMEAWVGAHATCAQQQSKQAKGLPAVGPAMSPQHQAPPPARSLLAAALVDAESEACAMAKPPAAAYVHAEAEAGTPGAMAAVGAEAAAQSAPPSGDASHPRPAAALRAACPRTAVPVTVAVAAARAGAPHLFMTEPLRLDACPSGELASGQALNYLTLTGVVRVRDPAASDSSQATARDQSWASVVPAGVSPCVREGPPSSRLRECSSSSIFNMWRRRSAMGGAEELSTPLNAPQLQAPPPGTHLPHMPRSLQLCRPGPVEEGEEGAPGAANAPGPAVLSACDDGEAAGAHEARDGAGNTNSLGRSLRSAARVLGQRILTFSGGVPGAPFSRRSLAAGGAAPMSVASSRPHSGSFRSGLFVRRSFGLRGRSERLADEDCPQGAAPCNQPGMSAPTTQELPRDSQADAVHTRTTGLPYVSAAVPSSALDCLAADAPRLLSLVVNRLPPPASPIQTMPLPLCAAQQPRQGAGPHATPDGRRDLGQAVLQGPTAQGRVAGGAAVQGPAPAVASPANSAALAAAPAVEVATARAAEQEEAPRPRAGKRVREGKRGPVPRFGSRMWSKLKQATLAAR